MAYVPYDWQTGEKITEERLDYMEQGIAEASAGVFDSFVINMPYDSENDKFVIDKTKDEILSNFTREAEQGDVYYNAKKPVFCIVDNNVVLQLNEPVLVPDGFDEQDKPYFTMHFTRLIINNDDNVAHKLTLTGKQASIGFTSERNFANYNGVYYVVDYTGA